MLSRRGVLGALAASAGPAALLTAPAACAAESDATPTGAPTVLAPPPSGGDDLRALASALPRTGILLLQAGTYHLGGRLTLGAGQDLVGAGGNLAGAATTLHCTASGAGLDITESAGISGNFLVDGASTAGAPVVRALGTSGAQRTFLNLAVLAAAGDGLAIHGAQNDCWIGCDVQDSEQDNLVLDQGAGGQAFLRCEFNAAGRYGLRSDAVVPGGPYVVPTDNTFDHCLFEREQSSSHTSVSSVHLAAADALTFTACSFYATSGSSGPRVDVLGPGTVTISGGRVQGESAQKGGTGLRVVDGGHVVLANQVRFENLATGIEIVSGNPTIDVLGNVFWNGVGARFGGGGNADMSVSSPVDTSVRVRRQVASGAALAVYVDGERGLRAQIGSDGSLGLGDGSGYTPKAELRAGAPGVLTMPPGQVVQTGRGPTTARPPAAAVGPGALFYDTTLRRPVWSNGTAWTDALGTPV
jgi:hypothetical protein